MVENKNTFSHIEVLFCSFDEIAPHTDVIIKSQVQALRKTLQLLHCGRRIHNTSAVSNSELLTWLLFRGPK